MSARTWRAGLARGWPLAAAGSALLAIGLALLAGTGGAPSLRFDDLALDEGASRTEATVTAVEPEGDHGDWVRVHYTFVGAAGTRIEGSCWDRQGRTQPGQTRTVEFLADTPTVNRLQDGRIAIDDRRATWPLGLLILPSLLLLLFWLRGAARWVAAGP